jgi:hypothetical protein
MSAVLSDLLPREPDPHAGAALMAGGTALLACLALLVCAFRFRDPSLATEQTAAARADQALYRGKAAGRDRVV